MRRVWKGVKRYGWIVLIVVGAILAWLFYTRWKREPNEIGEEIIGKIDALRKEERKAKEKLATELRVVEAKHADELKALDEKHARKIEELRADPERALAYINRRLTKLRAERAE